MAGGTYLDMFLWSNISPNYISTIFNTVTKSWINTTLVIDIYGDVLENNARIESTNDVIFKGCIGCIDR